MVTKMFELRQSDKLVAKILVAFFVVALALVMAFAPAVETVALANEVNRVCAAVGTIAGMLMGSATFSAMWATAGVTLTIALCSDIAAALICFIVAMGVGMLVSSLVSYITSEKSLDLFDITFWQALQTSWDRAKQKVVCSAAVFQMIVSKIRQALGIESKDNNSGYSSTFKAVTAVPTMSDFDLPVLDGTGAKFDDLCDGTDTGDIKSFYYSKKVYFDTDEITSTNTKNVYYYNLFSVGCAGYGYCGPSLGLIPCVNINEKEMYLCTLTVSSYRYAGFYANYSVSYKNNLIFTGNNGDEVNIIKDSTNYHLYCVQPDGKIVKPENIANLIYLVLYKNYNVVATKISDDVLSGKDNVSDISDSDAANVNTFENGDLKNLGKTKSIDGTYSEKNDRTKGIYDSIKSTGKTTVDINRIKVLLESVPGKMEISAINLTNGYSLSLIAGEQEINQAEFEKALNELNQILKKYKEIDDNIKLLK